MAACGRAARPLRSVLTSAGTSPMAEAAPRRCRCNYAPSTRTRTAITWRHDPVREDQGQRLASGDPRLSLEERYGDHAGYVRAVTAAAANASRRASYFRSTRTRSSRKPPSAPFSCVEAYLRESTSGAVQTDRLHALFISRRLSACSQLSLRRNFRGAQSARAPE